MMIQIEWWSRSSDVDLDLVMMSHDDPDLKDEDEDDLKTQKTRYDKMIQLIQRRRPVLKIVSKEYLPS